MTNMPRKNVCEATLGLNIQILSYQRDYQRFYHTFHPNCNLIQIKKEMSFLRFTTVRGCNSKCQQLNVNLCSSVKET